MKYIVRTDDGEEVGPLDQDLIIQWIKHGKVTADTEIRNSLMKSWLPAKEMAVYQDFMAQKAAAAGETEKPEEEEFTGPKEAVFSLNMMGQSKFVPAGPIQRLCAWFMDLLFTGGVPMLGIYVLMTNIDRLSDEILQVGFLLITIGTAFWYLAYYTIGLGFKAQTFGQWFWGIMILRSDGKPVFAGRAFVYALLYPFLALTSPLFYIIMPERRTLQELLSGTRIIRIKRSK